MPVASADGNVWNPVVILQECKPIFRGKTAGYMPEGFVTEPPTLRRAALGHIHSHA